MCEACLLHCTEEFAKIVLAQSTACGPCFCDRLEVVKAFDLGMILRVWGSSKSFELKQALELDAATGL